MPWLDGDSVPCNKDFMVGSAGNWSCTGKGKAHCYVFGHFGGPAELSLAMADVEEPNQDAIRWAVDVDQHSVAVINRYWRSRTRFQKRSYV